MKKNLIVLSILAISLLPLPSFAVTVSDLQQQSGPQMNAFLDHIKSLQLESHYTEFYSSGKPQSPLIYRYYISGNKFREDTVTESGGQSTLSDGKNMSQIMPVIGSLYETPVDESTIGQLKGKLVSVIPLGWVAAGGTVKIETYEGRKCYHITNKNGDLWVDQSLAIWLKSSSKSSSGGTIVTEYHELKDIGGGFVIPMKMVTFSNGKVAASKAIKKFSINTEVPNSVFKSANVAADINKPAPKSTTAKNKNIVEKKVDQQVDRQEDRVNYKVNEKINREVDKKVDDVLKKFW